MTQAQQIRRQDVQSLLHRVSVRPDHRYSRRFPDEHACNVTIHLEDGRTFGTEKRDYEGFTTRPATWDAVRRKFDRLTTPRTSSRLREDIANVVFDMDTTSVATLTDLLAAVDTNPAARAD